MSQCRTCQREIIWAVTANGKRVPLDPPEKRYVDNRTGHEIATDAPLSVVMDLTWLSHFATCPQADEHRKTSEPLPGSTEDYRGD